MNSKKNKNMIIDKPYRSIHILLGFLLLSLFSFDVYAQPDGAGLFKANCATCHTIGNGKMVGPDLKNVHQRRPEEWLKKWIKNSQAVIKSGDAYAVDLFKQYNNTVMPNQDLKDDELTAVLAYIKAESSKAPAVSATAAQPAAGGQEQSSDSTMVILIICAIVLYVLYQVLKRVKNTLAKVVREKEGLPEPILRSNWQSIVFWIKHHKKAFAVILLVLFSWGMYEGWVAMWNVGVTTGYQPAQPIAFSHKIHAGDNAINCQYCHSGAAKGKTAGIPTANVCMNCHKAIKSGTITGTTEISKIYKALDYDPETGVYGKNSKPIVWTRVHNLPDFAYFNHSQHVKVGGIDCAACHGKMDTMTVANQASPLTMGWCIDCHRRTPVKMEGNGYYKEWHQKFIQKQGKDFKPTVANIGGTECARCHY